MIYAWFMRQMPLIVLSFLILGSAWLVGAWLMEKGRQELRPEIERLQNDLKAEQMARIRNEEAIDGYITEIESIRNRPRSTGPVRLCVTPPVPNTDFPAPDFTGATTTTWGDSGTSGGDLRAGPDIGPPLRDLAFSCDAENAKLRALQNWVRSWVQ